MSFGRCEFFPPPSDAPQNRGYYRLLAGETLQSFSLSDFSEVSSGSIKQVPKLCFLNDPGIMDFTEGASEDVIDAVIRDSCRECGVEPLYLSCACSVPRALEPRAETIVFRKRLLELSLASVACVDLSTSSNVEDLPFLLGVLCGLKKPVIGYTFGEQVPLSISSKQAFSCLLHPVDTQGGRGSYLDLMKKVILTARDEISG